MARKTEIPIQKRFSDVDSFHHVNNVSQQMYFDVGKVDYYRRVLGEDVLFDRLRIITVATSTSYLGQIRLEDEIAVTTVASKVGNKSVTLAQQLIHTAADGSRRAGSESTSVMVAFDFAAQQAVPVPDAWRERMLGDGTDLSHSR